MFRIAKSIILLDLLSNLKKKFKEIKNYYYLRNEL